VGAGPRDVGLGEGLGGLRLLQLGAGLPFFGAALGEDGLGVEELLVQLRRINLGEDLAGLDAVAPIDGPALEVAAHPGAEVGLLVGEHRGGERQGAGGRRLGGGDPHHAGRGFVRGGGDVFPLGRGPMGLRLIGDGRADAE
jgi:hypothetical protein